MFFFIDLSVCWLIMAIIDYFKGKEDWEMYAFLSIIFGIWAILTKKGLI